MVELNPIEQAVLRALGDLGATAEDKPKTADDVTRKANRPKGQVNNALVGLVQKGVVGRRVREKASGYYVKARQ
ncbi:MAG: helix-turn-helix domain-containing protein [Candidatus ainarchaeum sp.]|nr:helix-turn-helix domain-containing protein [Candidatus ainarchaeum sp.]